MRIVVAGSLFVSLVANAAPLEAGLASRGSPIGGIVLAIAVGLALRMARRRRA